VVSSGKSIEFEGRMFVASDDHPTLKGWRIVPAHRCLDVDCDEQSPRASSRVQIGLNHLRRIPFILDH
jgi:hypothetical protein